MRSASRSRPQGISLERRCASSPSAPIGVSVVGDVRNEVATECPRVGDAPKRPDDGDDARRASSVVDHRSRWSRCVVVSIDIIERSRRRGSSLGEHFGDGLGGDGVTVAARMRASPGCLAKMTPRPRRRAQAQRRASRERRNRTDSALDSETAIVGGSGDFFSRS